MISMIERWREVSPREAGEFDEFVDIFKLLPPSVYYSTSIAQEFQFVFMAFLSIRVSDKMEYLYGIHKNELGIFLSCQKKEAVL